MRELDSGATSGTSAFTDTSMPPRAAGIPLKRATCFDHKASSYGNNNGQAAGNGKENRAAIGNGKYKSEHSEQNRAREETLSCSKGKRAQFRTFKGEAIDCGFCKSGLGLYRIAIFVIALCFLTIIVMQGTLILIVNHTDFLTIPIDEVSRGFETPWILPGTVAISDCERAVRNAMENFTEKLSLRASISELSKLERDSRRPPQIALICPTLEYVPDSVHLSTIARGLQWLGYRLELYGRQDGALRPAWEDIGVPVHIVQNDWQNITVDWSNFEGVLAVSLDAKKILESLAQEPFVDIPVLWIINEDIVLDRNIAWNASAELQAVYISWLDTFNRSTAVVFSNYFLPMIYNDFYVENFFVIPGSPRDVWEAEQYMLTHTREDVRAKAGLSPDDYVVVLVRSPCSREKSWREHAIVMKAVASLTSSSDGQGATLGRVRLLIFGHGNPTSSYDGALQMMAQHVGLTEGAVKHVGVDRDIQEVLWLADTVVYGSIWEELSFPPMLTTAMSLERPVIVPNLSSISRQVVDCKSGFIFPAGDDQALGQVLWMVKSNPILAQNVALEGASLARTLLARDAVVEYGYLLEKVLDFPSEAQLPRPTAKMQEVIPQGWQWDFLREPVTAAESSTVKDLFYLQSGTDLRFVANVSDMEDLETAADDFDFLNEDMSLEQQGNEIDKWEQAENDMMKDRLDSVGTTFEEVKKKAKKTEIRVVQDKHVEIDQLEVERVAQPLSIYEPYYGSGAWSFLHRDHLLYRGLSLSPHGRRPYLDDVDGASRLRLLNDSYYRDVLCDVAGVFAIAKFIDRVHRNSWIGFQPWRAISRKVALQLRAETALLEAISTEKHGDALYFWAQLESKNSQPTDDFWGACNFANAGNCRTVFYDTFKEMYGLPSSWTQFPTLPRDGGTWAAMHCWAMPTTSFIEFVMFARSVNVRMFANALDALQYEDHHQKGSCCFKFSRIETKHCYCNFLEGLVNIWAYHSARRMIYLEPESGLMLEQHNLGQRKGKMRVKWFRRSLLKSMDEDLAEEADEGSPDRRWLWPETGEVYWVGTREKERGERFAAKMERKRRQLERRARQNYKQRAIGGRYAKQSKAAKE